MRFFVIATSLVATVICVLAPSGAFAQNEDVFIVPRVPVQAQADSAGAAKRSAIEQGRRRAMDILLRRLTAESDWVYLPSLLRDEPATATVGGVDGRSPIAISPELLLTLENGFVVYGEKSSAKTYRAFITYRFEPDTVRNLLRSSRIPYSESQTRTALVLPVLQTSTNTYLWEPRNPWMAAWKARPYTHELTPITAPLGDLEDAARISADGALRLEPAGLSAMAENYGVSQVVIAVAQLVQADGEDKLTVRLIDGYRTAPASDAVAGDAMGLNQIGPAINAAPQPVVGSKVGDTLASTIVTGPSGDFPNLALRAIELVLANYSADWKSKTLIDYAKETVLTTTAFFDGVEEWASIRAALIETQLVEAVQVSALSRRGAEMRMRIFGDPTRLVTALESRDLVLWSETGARWFIATPDTAAQFKGQRFLRAEGPSALFNATTRPESRASDFDNSNDFRRAYDDKVDR